jgi:hypothetical protein
MDYNSMLVRLKELIVEHDPPLLVKEFPAAVGCTVTVEICKIFERVWELAN